MKKENMKFEDKIKTLEKTINELESGEVDLEESIKKYTEAMKLVQECDKQLKEIEKQSNMIYSSRAVCIRTNPDIYNAKFLYHLLSTEKYRNKLLNEVYNNGSYPDTYQISTVRLKKFKVPNIPIEEQKKILEKENKITMQIDKLQKELFALYDKI